MMDNVGYTQTIKNMRQRTARMEHEGDYWSDEEKRQLRILFEQGIGISEMAVRLQRSERAIYQQIEKMDLYGRKANPKRNQKQKAPSCLCSRCKCARNACPRYPESQSNQEGI